MISRFLNPQTCKFTLNKQASALKSSKSMLNCFQFSSEVKKSGWNKFNLQKNDPKYIEPDVDDEYHIDTAKAIKYNLSLRMYDSEDNYFNYDKLIHPQDYNSKHMIGIKKFFRQNPQDILLSKKYSKALRGISLTTEDQKKAEFDKDEVVIDVEKLNLWRDVIFFKYLNPKKELADMHVIIHGFFWSIVWIGLIHGCYLLYIMYLKTKKVVRSKKELTEQKEMLKANKLLSNSQSPGQLKFGFNFDSNIKELNWALKDMEKHTKVD